MPKEKKQIVDVEGAKLLVSSETYSPCEDSEMLAAAVKKFAFGSFLDVGCGSGLQSIVAAKKSAVKKVVGVDLNEEAVELSEKNAALNAVAGKCLFFKSDLFSSLRSLPKAHAQFDCIAFNPPYLPTSQEEKVKGKLNLAFDGGLTGRELMDKFISETKQFLAQKGIVLLLSSSLSSSKQFEDGNLESAKKLGENGFASEIVERQKFFFEELVVFKAELRQ